MVTKKAETGTAWSVRGGTKSEEGGTSGRPGNVESSRLHLRTVGVGSVGSSFLTMLRRELLMLLPLLCSLRGAAAANTSSGCTVTLDGAKAAQW